MFSSLSEHDVKLQNPEIATRAIIQKYFIFFIIRSVFYINKFVTLISPKNISGIHFLLHIIQHTIVTIGNNRLTLFLKGG